MADVRRDHGRAQQGHYAEQRGTDFSHVVPDEGSNWRFRVNLFKQLGLPGMVARKVEQFIPDFEGLYLPPVMEELCKYRPGDGTAGGGHRLGQVDHDRLDAELGEPQLPQAHPDDRRPDRIRVHPGQVPHQPARTGHGRQGLPHRHDPCRPRRSGHHARGRNARSRDLRDRHSCRRNRSPRVRDDPRLERSPGRSAVFSTCSRRTCTRRSVPAWASTCGRSSARSC